MSLQFQILHLSQDANMVCDACKYFCKRSKCPPMHLTPFDAPSPPPPSLHPPPLSGCIARPGGWGGESWSRWGAAGKSDPGSVDALGRPLKPGRVGSERKTALRRISHLGSDHPSASVSIRHISAQLSCTSLYATSDSRRIDSAVESERK